MQEFPSNIYKVGNALAIHYDNIHKLVNSVYSKYEELRFVNPSSVRFIYLF